MKINNFSEIHYDLNNENEKAVFEEFQKNRKVVDEYFQGKVTADQALAFLKRSLKKYEDKKGNIPTGFITYSQLFNIAFHTACIEKMQGLIDEVETAESEKLKNTETIDDRATAYLTKYYYMELRKGGIPKNENKYIILKPHKVPGIFRVLEETIHMPCEDISNYMRRTMIQSSGVLVDKPLERYLKTRHK